MGRKAVFGNTAMLHRCMILMAVLILALSLTGCGAKQLNMQKPDVKSIIWQQNDQFVRIEGQDRDTILVAANNHPATFSANLIQKTLGSLEVQFEGDDKTVPVFSKDELEILGETVSRGLAQAGPHEDITFAVAGIHQGHTSPTISTYRLFIENDRLNLIIGTLHGDYAKNMDRSRSPLVPGSRKYIPATASWSIVPRPGMKYKTNGALTSDVFTRRDWLILNPAAETFREAAQIWEDSAQFEAQQHEIHQKIKEMERSIEQMKQTPTTGAPEAEPALARPMGVDQIEKRLQILQQLKDKGLIDDDDFRAKKQEIIDSI